MWHNGNMRQPTTKKKDSYRLSVPPYYVMILEKNLTVWNYPGRLWESLKNDLAPTVSEVREMLIRQRRELRWSRSTQAGFLGVSRHVIRRWETGERNPSGAARRLIWLVNKLMADPKSLRHAFDFIYWGKTDELMEFARQLGW
jgi:DNA-binding transcriptional regulator YiaG